MPNVTENYGLKKPLPEEFYDIGVHNENMDIIDEALGEHKIKTFTSLEQIGLTTGSETMESIAQALPDNSLLVVMIKNESNNMTVYPINNNGVLTVNKISVNRVFFEYKNVASDNAKVGRLFIGTYYSAWSGWREIAKIEDVSGQITTHNTNPSAHSDIRESMLPKSGGTMTGTLTIPQAVIDDNIVKGYIMGEGSSAKLQIIAQEKSTGRDGMLIVSPNGLFFLNEDGYEYRVIHEGNMAQFLGVAPATVE